MIESKDVLLKRMKQCQADEASLVGTRLLLIYILLALQSHRS